MNTPQDVGIRAIRQQGPRTLHIAWSDGREDELDVVTLRRQCPCAVCVDEWTRQRRLKPEDIAESVRPTRIDSVGSYAIKISYSDGHDTGIYTYNLLRQMPKSS